MVPVRFVAFDNDVQMVVVDGVGRQGECLPSGNPLVAFMVVAGGNESFDGRRYQLGRGNHNVHVYDRFGGEPWYGGAADVFDLVWQVTQVRRESRPDLLEPQRPARVVLDDLGGDDHKAAVTSISTS